MHRWLAFVLGVPLAAASPGFNRDIRPILSDRCFVCHGPDAANRKANLRLDHEPGAKANLGTAEKPRFAIVPGDPASSELIRRVTSSNKAMRMPPAYAGHDALPARDVDLLRRWIADGAAWQQHWSLIAPKRPALPPASNPAWPRNAIDHLVLARLDLENLRPSPEADRTTLIRRLTLDLTGLAPTPAEVDAFLADTSPRAYENAVDRLLASPRYAERMAIRWLEAARYADTNGYQTDGVRTMWRWRDWVIDAFHRNQPFDQFTIEQLAGDLLPNASLEQRMATAFHRNHRTSAEGGIIDEEFRVEYVADRVETTATVWLGLTLGCARCHDHKYDPLTQREFYQFFSFFNNVPERGFVYNFGNEEPYILAPTPEQQSRLAALKSRVTAASDAWNSLAGTLARAQRRWEKSLRKLPELSWQPAEGLILHQPLADNPHFDGKREVDLGTEAARFNHRDPMTLAAWIYPETTQGAVLSRMEDYFEGTGYAIYLLDGKVRFHTIFRWTDLGMRIETRTPVQPGQWHHIAVTYDGSMKAAGAAVYINGVKQELNILFDQHLWPVSHKAPFRIGSAAGGAYRFRGRIEDVRVYNRALRAEEAAVLPVRETLASLASIRQSKRTSGQAQKLRLAFLDRYLPPEPAARQRDLRSALDAYTKYEAGVPTLMVMVEGAPRKTHLLKRGAYDAPGEDVTAGTPAALPPMDAGQDRNRLGLARWLFRRDNPLTARVAVNRYWQMLFGSGLVRTIEDFGSQGDWPLHQELLDWLAVEFADSGWNIKHILKTIVMSATYRQASRVTPELQQRDPENRLLARGARLRLGPEMIRDQALAISGLLFEQAGGPSVKPYQPPGLWQELAGGDGYKADTGGSLYRRSLYTYWRRTIPPPAMVTFDSPTRETCVVRESRTNTPLQALNLMNDVIYLEAARRFAARMILEGGTSPASRLRHGFRLALARPPRDGESAVLLPLLEKYEAGFIADPAAAAKFLAQGESKPDAALGVPQLAAYTAVASLILNLDETLTKE